MDIRKIIDNIVKHASDEGSVEGVFLAGSLASADRDDFSDVDVGLVSKDTLRDFRKAYTLREEILNDIGQPLCLVEREWEHCKMVAALYGKSRFPPIGLEVDLVFSQLKHVEHQMPYANSQIIFDRSGALKAQLDQLPRKQPKDDVGRMLRQHLSGYPFHLYELAKALGRKDWASAQSAAEQMRTAIYYTAAARTSCTEYAATHGAKRALRHLSPSEKWIVENSYQTANRKTVQKLTDLYITCLTAVQAEYQLEEAVEQFKQALPDLF